MLSEPAVLDRVVLSEATSDRQRLGGLLSFTATCDGLCHGLACWFRAELIPGLVLTNRPPNPTPSWSHLFLALEKPLAVVRGQQLEAEILASDNASHWHWWASLDNRRNGQEGGVPIIRQSTTAGRLVAPLHPDSLNARPIRNVDAAVDLLILQQLDGETTVAEIAEHLATRFAAHFGGLEDAIEHVRNVLDYYGCMTEPQLTNPPDTCARKEPLS